MRKIFALFVMSMLLWSMVGSVALAAPTYRVRSARVYDYLKEKVNIKDKVNINNIIKEPDGRAVWRPDDPAVWPGFDQSKTEPQKPSSTRTQNEIGLADGIFVKDYTEERFVDWDTTTQTVLGWNVQIKPYFVKYGDYRATIQYSIYVDNVKKASYTVEMTKNMQYIRGDKFVFRVMDDGPYEVKIEIENITIDPPANGVSIGRTVGKIYIKGYSPLPSDVRIREIKVYQEVPGIREPIMFNTSKKIIAADTWPITTKVYVRNNGWDDEDVSMEIECIDATTSKTKYSQKMWSGTLPAYSGGTYYSKIKMAPGKYVCTVYAQGKRSNYTVRYVIDVRKPDIEIRLPDTEIKTAPLRGVTVKVEARERAGTPIITRVNIYSSTGALLSLIHI